MSSSSLNKAVAVWESRLGLATGHGVGSGSGKLKSRSAILRLNGYHKKRILTCFVDMLSSGYYKICLRAGPWACAYIPISVISGLSLGTLARWHWVLGILQAWILQAWILD
jgi:hypothetical protein